MIGLTSSELLLYGGICIMAGTFVVALVSVIIFARIKKKLREKLTQEYGNLQK